MYFLKRNTLWRQKNNINLTDLFYLNVRKQTSWYLKDWRVSIYECSLIRLFCIFCDFEITFLSISMTSCWCLIFSKIFVSPSTKASGPSEPAPFSNDKNWECSFSSLQRRNKTLLHSFNYDLHYFSNDLWTNSRMTNIVMGYPAVVA